MNGKHANDSPQCARLRRDALAIWSAGVDAVTPKKIFQSKVSLDRAHIHFGETQVDLNDVRRIVVVGAGKASAAMAIEFYRQVAGELQARGIECMGWINSPAGAYDPAAETGRIHLHAARPQGINEPTASAVEGTKQILRLVQQATQQDLVICLLSGGGSALLVAPTAGVSLEDKQHVARLVAAAGGDIQQLNTVRRCLSDVKGGGLARACRAPQLVTAILSDVLGDPLDTIASGPTLTDASVDRREALSVLEKLRLLGRDELRNVAEFLRQPPSETGPHGKLRCRVEHVILANNADAVDAAGVKAVELGYRYVMQAARSSEGDVLQVAETAARATQQIASGAGVDCWISGGEPTVTLPSEHGIGGRNQQLALAVMQELVNCGWPKTVRVSRDVTFLSGGTDGEDGPTDAAGAQFDATTWHSSQQAGLQIQDFLMRADAHSFFEQVGGLIRTGPTGTNVCDLRVALAGELVADRSAVRSGGESSQ